MLEVTDDEGSTHLLIGIKYTGIVIDPNSPIRNTPHSTIRVFYETKVGNYQQKTEAAIHQYL